MKKSNSPERGYLLLRLCQLLLPLLALLLLLLRGHGTELALDHRVRGGGQVGVDGVAAAGGGGGRGHHVVGGEGVGKVRMLLSDVYRRKRATGSGRKERERFRSSCRGGGTWPVHGKKKEGKNKIAV